MIKHIVMWRLQEHALGRDKLQNAQLIQEKLEALEDIDAGILKVEVGLDMLHIDASADIVLYSEFSNLEALQYYQDLPAHIEAKELITQVSSERYVVDYKTQ